MRYLIFAVLLIAIVSPAQAATLEPLHDICGYSIPVTNVEVVANLDGGTPYTVDQALYASLDSAEGRIANNQTVNPSEWIEDIRINGSLVEVYAFNGSYRLRCEGTGLVVRTDDTFFRCHLAGEC